MEVVYIPLWPLAYYIVSHDVMSHYLIMSHSVMSHYPFVRRRSLSTWRWRTSPPLPSGRFRASSSSPRLPASSAPCGSSSRNPHLLRGRAPKKQSWSSSGPWSRSVEDDQASACTVYTYSTVYSAVSVPLALLLYEQCKGVPSAGTSPSLPGGISRHPLPWVTYSACAGSACTVSVYIVSE